ncbi:MAG: hypothetical protein A4E53_03015 [Pelotomaculum sp. PtaB.Bin104]|nr:MAG: hypothetical protein A4E53_03015 [Pelotomaculum sp. PtaB.Bin104]
MDNTKTTTTIPGYYSTFNKFMEEYFDSLRNQSQTDGASAGTAKDGVQYLQYEPVFIPLYLYPVPPACPTGSPAPDIQQPVYQPAPYQIGNNAYILFLIFILILLGTRKEQIFAAIKSFLKVNDH